MHDSNSVPAVVLSQDYELFFGSSGTVDQCLFEPCAVLCSFARARNSRITFYVDAGMLVAMKRYASHSRQLRADYDAVRKHVADLSRSGHEIGLHVHPHWQDSRWTKTGWDFADTRYKLSEFPDNEVASIVNDYADAIQDLAIEPITSFRAGGFCVEPFVRLAPTLSSLGITIDSSVIPGATLDDPAKGFDFSAIPNIPGWRFDNSPSNPSENGQFVELPITPLLLPITHYWRRLVDRLKPGPSSSSAGDGVSKAIGRREIVRRLLGAGRLSELSTDAAKAHHLSTRRARYPQRQLWHIMGHPKLLGRNSLDHLAGFLDFAGVERSITVTECAQTICSE